MSYRKLILLLALTASISGCETQPVVQMVNPAVVARMNSIDQRTRAKVVIYRVINPNDPVFTPSVTVNGDLLAKIPNGRVFVGAVPPGNYTFEMADRKTGTQVGLRPGQTLYLRVETVQEFLNNRGALKQMAPEQGTFEAQRCELIDPQDILNPAFR